MISPQIKQENRLITNRK